MGSNMLRILVAVVMLGALGAVQADERESDFQRDVKQVIREIKVALDSIDLYRVPQVPQAADEELTLTCRELEWAMAAVVPKTYSYRPSFYDDPVQGGGMWIGTMYYPVYATALYGVYHDYKEDRRIISAEDRIEVLRRLKAEKRCYES